MLKSIFGGLVLALASFSLAFGQTISHEIPAPVAGGQNFGGALGMDFNVVTPITVTELGLFDSNGDNLIGASPGAPFNARIYNRAASFTSSPVATIQFTSPTDGTLVGSQRFQALPQSLILPAGFQGTIVGEGYRATELNGNGGGVNFDGTLLNTGGGAISFVGTGRYGVTAGQFPGTPDGGPAGRYGAGTFVFNSSTATPITLQNATAVFSQPSFPVNAALDGNASPGVVGTGWANSALGDNTAVFETAADVTSQYGSRLQFTLTSGGFGALTLGRFRVSATEDDRSTFADGLANGGDVTANWTPLDLVSILSGNPATSFTELIDGSLLASGASQESETYTLLADAPLLDAITGFRIELLEDPSFPANGPGRSGNGNFVLLELSALQVRGLTAQEAGVPEPATIVIWSLLGVLGMGGYWVRSRKQRAGR